MYSQVTMTCRKKQESISPISPLLYDKARLVYVIKSCDCFSKVKFWPVGGEFT